MIRVVKKIVPLIKVKFKGLPIKEQGEFTEGKCSIEISPEYRAWLRYYDESRLVSRRDNGIPSQYSVELQVPFSVYNALSNSGSDASASVYILQKHFRNELTLEFPTSLNVFERIKSVIPKVGEYIYTKVKLAKYSDSFEIKMELDIKTEEGITGEVEIIGESNSSPTTDQSLYRAQSRHIEPEEEEHYYDGEEDNYDDEEED